MVAPDRQEGRPLPPAAGILRPHRRVGLRGWGLVFGLPSAFEKAQGNIYNLVNQNQKEFIDFVLRNYVQEGVDELDISKLSATLTSKYGSVFEGQNELGEIDEIQRVFIDFQQHLYNEEAA